MKKLLVPVDFSAATENVLEYVAAYSYDSNISQVILLKTAQPSVYERILPATEYLETYAEAMGNQEMAIRQRFDELTASFMQKIRPGVKVEVGISGQPLLRSIHDIIEQSQPDMIVLTSDQRDIEEGYIGAQIIQVVKSSPIPVMVIPGKALYKPIDKVLVPIDFNAISRLSILSHSFLAEREKKPELIILNIDKTEKRHDPDEAILQALSEVLHDYEYSVLVSPNRNVLNGIVEFTKDNDVDLVVALPGKYSFFYNLTHSTITDALALNARKPVLIYK
jgi:nucleotide-binding universal stress UspA family protein